MDRARLPETVEEIQSSVAKMITGFPPEIQGDILAVIDLSYLAGYRSCQRDIRTAASALNPVKRQN